MLRKESLKWFSIAVLLGCLSVGIIVAGILIGFILAMLTPVLIVFTGLWIWRVINIELDDDAD